MNFQTLMDVAQRHNETDVLEKIKVITENSETFKIAIIGRFGSGKSSLINTLLEKPSLLPTGLSESTAKITFINYDEKEYLVKVLKDGTEVASELSFLNKLDLDNKEIEAISYLKVYINNENLKGITLIDTPGISGLNENAKDISYDFLPNVDLALYVVFPEGFHEEDERFLNFSEKYLSHIIPIINQADRVTDKDTLAKHNSKWLDFFKVPKKHPMFFYSAKMAFDYNNSGNVALKKYLFEYVLQEKEKIKAESIKVKTNYLTEKLQDTIEKKITLLNTSINDPEAELKIEKLKNQTNKITFELESKKSQLASQLKAKNSDFIDNLKEEIKDKAFEMKNELEILSFDKIDKNFRDNLKKETKDFLFETQDKWLKELQDEASKIAGTFQKSFNEEVNSLFKTNFNFNLSTNIKEFEAIDLEKIMLEMEGKKQKYLTVMEELKYSLKEHSIDITEIAQEKKEIEEYLKSYNSEAETLLKNFNEVNSLPPEYVEVIREGSASTGEAIGSFLGNIADWGLLFVPGTQIKYLEPIIGVAKGLGASKEIIDKIRGVEKKIAKGNELRKEFEKILYSQTKLDDIIHSEPFPLPKRKLPTLPVPKDENNSNLLDRVTQFMNVFSIKKWGGEIGKALGDFIDPPIITRQIDPKWEKSKNEALSNLNIELEDLKSSINDKERSGSEKAKKISQIEKNIDNIQNEIKAYEKMCENLEKETAKFAQNEKAKEDSYRLYLQNSVDMIFNEANIQFTNFTNKTIEHIINNLTLYILSEIRKQKEEIIKLLEETQSNYNNSKEEKLNTLASLKHDLEVLK